VVSLRAARVAPYPLFGGLVMRHFRQPTV
jgi:hypothetical protein